MTDIVSVEKRSSMMSAIHGKDTNPERIIRKGLHAKGFRFRLHNKKLPGRPDLTLKKHNAVIFVHGCFWHGHEKCHLYRLPKTNKEFWEEKITANINRDARNTLAIMEKGWRVLIVWECCLKGKYKLPLPTIMQEISSWLRGNEEFNSIRGSTVGQ